MKCPHCKNEVNTGGDFCPVCGKELNTVAMQQPAQQTHKKCYYVFAKVGYWLAVAAFIISFIPFFNMSMGVTLGIAAIVFICLGKRTNPAKTGMGFAIAAIVLSIVLGVVASMLPYFISLINTIIAGTVI